MKFVVKKSNINGIIDIPGSKSHTIRSLFFATLAKGQSKILKPLISEDAISSLNTCKAFGGNINNIENGYIV
ncbi:MAG TPA: 3-phosphoshikimate 1-carboxyvinyltransferase, partial [Spirochaetota bacterium]|nr:3-phosphoshikimate 1-carboxyvinyltransferase [Spirochaetota bacterium]